VDDLVNTFPGNSVFLWPEVKGRHVWAITQEEMESFPKGRHDQLTQRASLCAIMTLFGKLEAIICVSLALSECTVTVMEARNPRCQPNRLFPCGTKKTLSNLRHFELSQQFGATGFVYEDGQRATVCQSTAAIDTWFSPG
jgi:hypothetical protein